LEDIETLSKLN